MAFAARVNDKADFSGVGLPSRPDGAKWVEEPKIVERAGYKRDRRGYIDTGWTHVFVVPAEGGTARQLTDGDWNHSNIAWSPDGTEIYFTSYRAEDWDRPDHWQESEIYAVAVASGEVTQLTDRRGPDNGTGAVSRRAPDRLHRYRGPPGYLPESENLCDEPRRSGRVRSPATTTASRAGLSGHRTEAAFTSVFRARVSWPSLRIDRWGRHAAHRR